MTDNEIIKALEWLERLKRDTDVSEWAESLKIILNEYNRQKAEIERLKDENKSIRYCYEQAKSYNDTLAESCEKNCKKFNMTTRAEAVKEFAERLKSKRQWDVEFDNKLVFESDIDNLIKEMTE